MKDAWGESGWMEREKEDLVIREEEEDTKETGEVTSIPEEIEEQSSSLITLQSKTLPASQEYPTHGDNTLEAGVLVEETLREVPLLETIVPEFQE